jgi:hypothetical protein
MLFPFRKRCAQNIQSLQASKLFNFSKSWAFLSPSSSWLTPHACCFG